MSKELTPLEALKELKYIHNIGCGEDKTVNERFALIETALKDYDRLLKLRKTAEWADEKLQTKKKLKAFEIITKKKVNVQTLLETKTYAEYNFKEVVIKPKRKLTQEEYELLKEILK